MPTTLKNRYLLATYYLVVFIFSLLEKWSVNARMTESQMRNELERLHIIPNVIQEGPQYYLWVEWMYGKKAEFGNMMDPHFLETKPVLIKWKCDEKKTYALIFIDADKSNEGLPGEYIHWLCVNIEGGEVLEGLNVAKYHPPNPAKDSGVHRYILLLYEQPNGRQYFEFSPIKDTPIAPSIRRTNFSIADFSRRNNLGRVLALNLFHAVYVADQTFAPGATIRQFHIHEGDARTL